MESQYSRESSKGQYLASNLNVRKMYELFIKEHSDIKVEEHFYRKVFWRLIQPWIPPTKEGRI